MGNAYYSLTIEDSLAVHPHVHGERFVQSPLESLDLGSSPRAWGTLVEFAVLDDRARFIPTCMGNASAGRPHPHLQTVHPHVHGERILTRRSQG